ncbi:MAG TPA: type VI secretion system accessory protein TagJ [Opitutaceae bacterium]
MTSEELVKAGRLGDALADLQSRVRAKPEDAKLRTFLFQLHCVMGSWPKALTQLEVLSGVDPDTKLLARVFADVIRCELLRKEVFSGKTTPIVFGEPADWIGLLAKAAEHAGRGDYAAAASLKDQAYEQAPATAGTLNGERFEWIADADSRLGPVLEVILEGRYCWVPFMRIKRIAIEPPTDLRDLVFTAAQFMWTNGGEAAGHIPTRYAFTEAQSDPDLLLARKTEWAERAPGLFLGLGQRSFTTSAADVPLLEIRTIDLEPAA